MERDHFTELSRAVGHATRRRLGGLFLTLGSAAFAATVPTATAAKKRRKGNARKKCTRQGGQCRSYFSDICAANAPGNEAACEATFFPCCAPLASCNAAGFFACLAAME